MPEFDALLARPPIADATGAPIRLRRGETIGLWLPPAARIAILSGRIWLTTSGDATDYFLAAGGAYRIPAVGRRCLVVCEGDADGTSVLSVSDARQ